MNSRKVSERSAGMSEGRMNAYYYSFTSTGVEAVDLILHAIACAGKAYHHTESWCDTCSPYGDCEGESPIDWIQNAANKAAKVISASHAAGRMAGLSRFREVLFGHYVTAVDCDHDTLTDTVRCACSVWTGTAQPSVGDAIREWIEHVTQEFNMQPTKETDRG